MKRFASLLITLLLTFFTLLPATTGHAVAAATNLIPNPSVETATGTSPSSWLQGRWGTNTTTFTYQSGGHTGSKSLYINMSKYTNGDAKWYFTDVAVTPGQKYSFSDYYKSNVATEVDVQYTDKSGNLSYAALTSAAASSTNWAATTSTFTIPTNIKTLTIFHVINKVGWLQTDDYNLNSASVTPTAPTVSFSTPASGATVSGTQTISANATDTIGMASVQFKIDGTNIGSAVTAAPYSVSWDSKSVSNGTHTISAVATNTSGLTATATESITVQNATATPPTISFSSPSANTSVSGTQSISANASDAVGVANVQFKIDGNTIGNPDASPPYSISWDSKTVANGNHTISAVATNTSGMTATTTETINVQNVVATPPSVSITAPANGSTISGTQLVSASASDAQGITSVQFKIDGSSVGNPATTTPYSYSWDTTTVANGNHTLSAVATNTSGLTATAATVTVNVQNAVVTPPPSNLISNASFETAQNSTTPQGWQGTGWGSNTRSYSYLNTGNTGGRSVEVQVSNYASGDADWYYGDQPVTVGQTYDFNDWYQSSVDTEVDAEVIVNGSPQYFYLGKAPASTAWANITTSFTVPIGATSMSVYHLIASNGYLITDDYSLTQESAMAAQFNRPIVSITFDDGWEDQYQYALPVLQADGLPATFYIISGALTNQPDYMTSAQVKNLYNDGMEIGSHTITHPDLTTLSQSQLVNEMSQSQATLQNLLGVPVTDFAYPYGTYNANTITVGEQYYQSQRSVDDGLNTRTNFDATKLKIHEVDSDISQAQVNAWVDEAIQQNAWLILVYHEVNTTPEASDDADYTTQPADLSAELGYIKQTGVTVETVHQALLETESQL